MRMAGFSDEFAQSVYSYKINDDESQVGIDLIKFYDLKINQNRQQTHAGPGEKSIEHVQLNMLEKFVLRVINVKVNLKLRYSMQEQYELLPHRFNSE